MVNARFFFRFWYRLHLSKVQNLIWRLTFFLSNFIFFELRDVFRTFQISNSGYNFFSKVSKISKIQNQKIIYKRDCSTSSSGGNQVDGSPLAPNTGAFAFWAHMPSSKSGPWRSNGSDFSKSVHYYCVTWILLWVNHVLEVSSLILSLWEAVVSDIDRRQLLKKWNFDFWDIFWNYEKL